MPCEHHAHTWPRGGVHELVIESCETDCGWCSVNGMKATNLRAVSRYILFYEHERLLIIGQHAKTHIGNDGDALRGITIAKGRAGRKRVYESLRATALYYFVPSADISLGD